MSKTLKKQLKTNDDINQFMDAFMADHNMCRTDTPHSINSDMRRALYKCTNKNCLYPYAYVIVTGLEEMQNQDDLHGLFLSRCQRQVDLHDCKGSKDLQEGEMWERIRQT